MRELRTRYRSNRNGENPARAITHRPPRTQIVVRASRSTLVHIKHFVFDVQALECTHSVGSGRFRDSKKCLFFILKAALTLFFPLFFFFSREKINPRETVLSSSFLFTIKFVINKVWARDNNELI